MPKSEWGSKHICQSCGAKFYDLQRDPIVCPACGTAFDSDTTTRSRRSRGAGTSGKVAKEAASSAEEDTVEIDDDFDSDDDVVGDDDDDSLLVADDDLDDDDDSIPGIVGGKDEED